MVINILDAARPTLLSQPLIDAPCSSIAKGEFPIAVGSSASNVPHPSSSELSGDHPDLHLAPHDSRRRGCNVVGEKGD